jgi:hypothetical protein
VGRRSPFSTRRYVHVVFAYFGIRAECYALCVGEDDEEGGAEVGVHGMQI